MAQEPANKRLWATLGAQARAKFRAYPSPAASHWVHEQYVRYGGKFIDTAQRAKAEKLGRQWRDRKEAEKAKSDKPSLKGSKSKNNDNGKGK
jgi:hypothetical protein